MTFGYTLGWGGTAGGIGGAPAVSWLGYDGSSDGSAITISTSTCDRIRNIAILSSSRAIIAYPDANNSDFVTVALLNVSGTAPVLMGSILVANSTTDADSVSIVGVDSQYAALVYDATGAFGRIIDKDGGGTDIIGLVGSEQDLSTNINVATTSNSFSVDLLDSTHLISIFEDSGSNDLYGSVITINTGTGAMTDNTITNLHAGTLSTSCASQVKAYSSTHFIATASESLNLIFAGGSVSGTTITAIDSVNTERGLTAGCVLPFISNDETVVICPYVSRELAEGSNLLIYDYDDTAGASAITATRSSGLLGQSAAPYHMETVSSDEYFLVATYIGGGSDNLALRGAKYDMTDEFFSMGAALADTGVVLNSTTLDADWLVMAPITGTKALVLFSTTGDVLKAYIANQ